MIVELHFYLGKGYITGILLWILWIFLNIYPVGHLLTTGYVKLAPQFFPEI